MSEFSETSISSSSPLEPPLASSADVCDLELSMLMIDAVLVISDASCSASLSEYVSAVFFDINDASTNARTSSSS
jgi:hypothetical protein